MLQTKKSIYLDAEAFADIADYYLQKKNIDMADDCIRYALTLHPENTELNTLLARRKIDDGNIEGAKEIEARLPKNDYEVKMLHGELLIIEMEVEKAEHFFRSQSKDMEDEEKNNLAVEVAGMFLDYDYPKRAINWLKSIPVEKYDLRCKQMEAECYIDLEQFGKAITLLNEILDNNPYEVRTWSLLCEAQFISGQYEEAIQSCDFALAIDGENELALKTKASCFYEMHDYKEALKIFNVYNQLVTDDGLSIVFTAICLNHTMRPDDALALLKKAGIMYQQDSLHLQLIYTQMADAYSTIGKVDEAMEYIEKAVHFGTDSVKGNLMKADILLENGKDKEGLQILSEKMHEPNCDEDTYLHIAIILCKHGFYNSSYSILSELIEYPGIDKSCYAYMALVQQQRGDRDSYLHYLEIAGREAPLDTKDIFGDEFPGIPPQKYILEAKKKGTKKPDSDNAESKTTN